MSGKMYYIDFSKEDIKGAAYAFTKSVSGNITLIAKKLDNLKQLVYNREYLSFPGEISSKRSATLFSECSFMQTPDATVLHCADANDMESAGLAQQESYDTDTVIFIAVNAIMKVVERDGKEGHYRERACSVER